MEDETPDPWFKLCATAHEYLPTKYLTLNCWFSYYAGRKTNIFSFWVQCQSFLLEWMNLAKLVWSFKTTNAGLIVAHQYLTFSLKFAPKYEALSWPLGRFFQMFHSFFSTRLFSVPWLDLDYSNDVFPPGHPVLKCLGCDFVLVVFFLYLLFCPYSVSFPRTNTSLKD